MIGFFGSLEIETGMGEEEVSYTSFQFANSRNFFFCFGGGRRGGSLFWRKEKGNGGGNRKGLHFVCQRWRSRIWGAGLAFGIAS